MNRGTLVGQIILGCRVKSRKDSALYVPFSASPFLASGKELEVDGEARIND